MNSNCSNDFNEDRLNIFGRTQYDCIIRQFTILPLNNIGYL